MAPGPLRPRLWLALAAAPIAASVFLAWHYFLPLPLFDYWDVLHEVYKADAGARLLLRYLWQPFVDQKMVIQKLWIFALSHLTGNRHYGLEIALGVLLQLGALGVGLRFVRGLRGLRPAEHSAARAATAAFFFWPALHVRFQHHWYSTQYGLVLFFGLLTLWLLHRQAGSWKGMLQAFAPAIAAAYTHGTGAALLVAVALLLALDRRWRPLQAGCWWLLAALCAWTILKDRPPAEVTGFSSPRAALMDPWHLLTYGLAAVALPAELPWLGALYTAVILLSLALLIRARAAFRGEFFPWWGILLWAGAVALATGMGRYPSPVPVVHYGCFFVLVPWAAAVLFLAARRVAPSRALPGLRLLGVGLLLGFAVLYVRQSVLGFRRARRMHREVNAAAARLQFLPLVVPSDLEALFPFPRLANTILPFLAARGLVHPPVDPRPLTRSRRVRFRLEERAGVAVVAEKPGGFRLRLTAAPAQLVLRPEEPFERRYVLALRIAPDEGLEGLLYWDDGRGFSHRRAEPLRLRPFGGRYWFLFVDPSRPLEEGRIRRLKLELRAPSLPRELQLAELRLWTHGRAELEGPRAVRVGDTLRLRFRLPSEVGRPYVAGAAWRPTGTSRLGGGWPLAVDDLTCLSLRAPGLFVRFRGTLPPGGVELRIRVPPWPFLAGRTFYVAAATLDRWGFRTVTTPHRVRILPRGGR